MIPWGSCVLWLGYPLQNGVWPDVSKHDNDGAITGAYWEEDSIEFDGIDDIVNCGNHTSMDITPAITIECLIKAYSLGGGDYGRIVDKTGAYRAYTTNTNRIVFTLYKQSGGTAWIGTNNNSLVFNEWTHFVGTWDGTIQKTYINAVQQAATSTWSGAILSAPTNYVRVGNTSDGTRAFDGKMAMVRIYNIGLTAQQVQEAYEQTYRLV